MFEGGVKMVSITIEDFIKYAQEQFDCDIILSPTDVPDSFESIFGEVFTQDTSVEIEDGFYENSFLDIDFCGKDVIDFSNIDLAA